MSRAFVLAGYRTAGAGTDIGERMLRAELTNSTTITFDRGLSGDNMTEIAWQVVELKDGSTVQRGTANFASGTSQVTAPLGPRVNTTRSVAFGSVQAGGGQNMGSSPYAADDIIGVGSVTAALIPTQLTLTRTSTADSASVGWFVVQFAGGSGFKVGSFSKSTSGAPASQVVAHGRGETPRALILWTEGRTDQTFSTAAIAFRASSTASAGSGALSLALPVPAGTQPNDVMIASVGFRPSGATVTPPAGWTLVRLVSGGGNGLATCVRTAASGEPASYTWTFSASTGTSGGIMSFSGVDLASPINVENGQTTVSALTHATPSVTTTVANTMVVTAHAFPSSATWIPPAGMAEAIDVASTAVPDCCGMSIEANYVLQAAAAATGAKTATASGDADTGTTQILALRPAASGIAYFGYGMTDGTTSRSVSASSQHNNTTSNASTRMTNKALTMVQWGQVVIAEADLTSWDSTTFTLNWTTNIGAPYVVHCIAIGGSDVSAKLVDWTMRTSPGNSVITGVGFRPDVVFHAHGTHAFTAALPSSQAHGGFGLGVMDFDGDEWSFANLSRDALGTSDTQRGQRTDASIFSFNQGLVVQKEASWVSMDADGFTMSFSTAGAGAARVFSLALKGVNVKPGSFNKTVAAAPAAQAITGVGFRPSLVMLASVQNTTAATPVAHSRFGLGASDGVGEASSASQDSNGAAVTVVNAIDKTSKAFIKVNNATPAIDAEANLASRDADGFTLSWTTNDAVATEILYLTMAPLAVTEVRLTSFTALRDPRGVRLAWQTGHETDNLGFHLYREIDGHRTRITRSLVAGSGLSTAARMQTTTGRSYSYWDRDASAQAAAALYWLQDVDFNGKATWHGPVQPVAAAASQPYEPDAGSRVLNGLGQGAGQRLERFLTGTPEPRIRAAGLRAMSDGAAGLSPRERQWVIANQPAVKIGVRAAGWYRVVQPTLLAAGLRADVDPRTLRLYVNGVEQAMLVTGQDDGRLDPGDAIEFYGDGLDLPSTDTRIYWLVSEEGTGLRVQTAPSGTGQPGQRRFLGTVERKDRSIYFAALQNGDAENWFGALISTGAALDVDVTVRHLDAVAPTAASLQVVLQGVTATADDVDHRVGVRVNGVDVGEVAFEGRAQGIATLPVPNSALRDGANVVQFVALGGEEDLTLFDTLRLTYWHTTDADDDRLRLTAAGGQTVTIGGFSEPGIRVVDITDLAAMVELRTSAGPGASSVTVFVPGTGSRTLLAFTDSTTFAPAFVSANTPSALHDPAQGHDYVVITHPDFVDQAVPLVTLRASEGRQAVLVSIEDVYDEFSYGAKSSEAVKDFLAHARTSWTLRPRYVLLVGDATVDPRDYAGRGAGDFVPTRLVDMAGAQLETASDDWFVDADGDGLPEAAIGRLPVRTPAQAALIVDRITGYHAGAGGLWTKQVTLVTDTDDPTVNFRATSASLEGLLPQDYTARRLDRDTLGTSALRDQLFDHVAEGRLVVNYLGHGSTHRWGQNGALLTVADVAHHWTATGSQLPFVVAMNCLNGYFHGIDDEESLAEALVRGGAAIAVWASSSLTDTDPQAAMNRELYRLMFGAGFDTLGDALVGAKGAVRDADVRRSWLFFGDPAMRLKGLPTGGGTPVQTVTVPNVVNLTQFSAASAIASARLTVGAVSSAPSETVAAGFVISQHPVAGVAATRGTPVDLVISTGAAPRTFPMERVAIGLGPHPPGGGWLAARGGQRAI
jgi:hypothetical protein